MTTTLAGELLRKLIHLFSIIVPLAYFFYIKDKILIKPFQIHNGKTLHPSSGGSIVPKKDIPISESLIWSLDFLEINPAIELGP